MGSMLKIDLRRGRILEKLKQEGAVSVSQLAAELGATTVTIRSDLDALEAEGYLTRVQGGAVMCRNPQQPPQPEGRESVNAAEKRAIVRCVADMVRDGDTLFINSGTTMQLLCAALRVRRNLNIVTNSLQVAMELGTVASFRVILLGGEINAHYGFTCGSDAQEQLGHYQADWAIMSLDGISVEAGLTTYHAQEAIINRMMIARSKQLLVAADHTKVGKAGFSRFHNVGPNIRLVTDGAVDGSAVEQLREMGVDVTIV